MADPILQEVMGYRLGEVVSTMEHLLFHSGYSPILRESHDGSAAILDQYGKVVIGSGAPYHLYPYYYTTQYIINKFKNNIRPGDSYLVNDPYSSGNSHVPDVAIVTPVFFCGMLIAFTACIAHKPDMGGLVPGSSGAGAREIFHEGILFPGVRIWSEEGINQDVESILRQNSRTPDEVLGDVRAQVGCTRVGAQKLQALCEEYSVDTVKECFQEAISIAERRFREELASIPDGVTEGEACLDNDGVDLDRSIRIHVTLKKIRDSITLDFSQTDKQVVGPVNIRPQSTEAGASLALIGLIDPTLPINEGLRRVIHFINPEGLVTNARFPAPVNCYYPTMHLVYCAVQQAFGALSNRIVAPAGLGVGGNTFGYQKTRSGKRGVQYELQCTSLGGTNKNDGSFATMTMNHFTPSTSIEILETEYPIRVTRFEPMIDSAGAGQYRGGLGYAREYLLLDEAKMIIRMAQFRHGSWGVEGGKPPRLGRAVLNAGTAEEKLLPPLTTLDLPAGSRVCIEMAGGGGYGDPKQRDKELVMEDVKNGYVSRQAATEVYG